MVACETYGRDGGIKQELNYKVHKGNHRKHNKTQILFSCESEENEREKQSYL